ncbi:hypothetical protein Lal_00038374 [Lupinus albus]|nr:hypothetical protein Lal_00038374 [Lupinus albus]
MGSQCNICIKLGVVRVRTKNGRVVCIISLKLRGCKCNLLLELWRLTLETHGLRISLSNVEYMECKFSKRIISYNKSLDLGSFDQSYKTMKKLIYM